MSVARLLHRSDDAIVDAAAAKVRIERGDDIGAARLCIARKQRRGRDQDSGQAIAALAGLLVEQRLLQRMQPAVPDQPSTVVMVLPSTVAASREQEYSGLPSISTMQAPHCSVPQPNLAAAETEVVAQHR